MIDLVIVEDNPLDVHLLQRVFSKELPNIKYKIFEDGEQVMNHLENDFNPVPKLIFLDIKLPKISGLKVLSKLRKMPHLEFVPVVVLSSSNQKKDIELAYKNGANSFLTKPGDFNKLKDCLKTSIEYWINYNKIISSHE